MYPGLSELNRLRSDLPAFFYASSALSSPKLPESTRYVPFPGSAGTTLFFLDIYNASKWGISASLRCRKSVYGAGGSDRGRGENWIPNYQFYSFDELVISQNLDFYSL